MESLLNDPGGLFMNIIGDYNNNNISIGCFAEIIALAFHMVFSFHITTWTGATASRVNGPAPS